MVACAIVPKVTRIIMMVTKTKKVIKLGRLRTKYEISNELNGMTLKYLFNAFF